MVGIVVLLVHDFAQAEVGDLDLAADVPLREEDVAGLQIVVYHRGLDLVQVLQGRNNLHHDRPRLSLRNRLVLKTNKNSTQSTW